jgi:hypothetical protein
VVTAATGRHTLPPVTCTTVATVTVPRSGCADIA